MYFSPRFGVPAAGGRRCESLIILRTADGIAVFRLRKMLIPDPRFGPKLRPCAY